MEINRKNSKIVVGIILLITFSLIFLITKLRFNYDFESFFSTNDEETSFYMDFRKNFENDSDYCLIGIENKDGIFKADFLKKVDALCTDLKDVKYMESVRSITNTKTFIGSSYAITPINLIHDDYQRLKDDSVNIFAHQEMIGTLVSKNGKALAIYVKKENMVGTPNPEKLTIKERETAWLAEVEAIVAKYKFDNLHLAGRIKAENYYISKMEWEIIVFTSASLLLVICFLFIAFRTLWGILLPLVVVVFAVIWSMGVIALFGQKMDIMTVLMPTIMFVVGMSDVIHITTKYLQELRAGKEKIAAVKSTLKDVGLATFITAFTTSLGFLTLMGSNVLPIGNFGFYTGIGVILAFVLSYTFLPAMLILLKTPNISHEKESKMFWTAWLHNLLLWILPRRKYILLTMGAICVISAIGISKIRVNAQLIDEVSEGDPLKDDFVFFEKFFSGVRPFEIALELGKDAHSINDYEVLKEIEKLEKYIQTTCLVNQISSPTTIYKVINRGFNNGLANQYKMPEKDEFLKAKKLIRKYKKIADMGLLTTKDQKMGRITGITTDIGSNRSQEIKNELNIFIAKNINPNLLKPRLTGSAYLIDLTNDNLSVNLMKGLTFSIVVIAIIMGLLFRSFKMIIISILPNIIPMLMIAAIIGYFDIGIKMSTSIIFTIAFGIAEDDTIHFMSKLKLELSKGKSLLYALKNTYLSTGKAIIITSLILISGFMILVFSDFKGTFYVGLLISLTLIFAMFTELLLMPVLLVSLVSNKEIDKMRSLLPKFKA